MSATLTEALAERRTIRRYLPQPVSDEVLREILAEARWAPSSSNTQTTLVYVLRGEALDRYKADLLACARSGAKPNSELGIPHGLPEIYTARQQALYKTRSEFIAAEEAKTGIKSPEGTMPGSPWMDDIYGTTVLLVLAADKEVRLPHGLFDAGILAQSIALAAYEHGLGSTITGSMVRYSDLVRKTIPGLENKDIIAAIALGYPDMNEPVNRFPRTRLSLEEFVTYVE